MCWGGGRALGLCSRRQRGVVVSSKAEKKPWTQQAAWGGAVRSMEECRSGCPELIPAGGRAEPGKGDAEVPYLSEMLLVPAPGGPCPPVLVLWVPGAFQPLQQLSRTCIPTAPCLGLTKSLRF